MGSSFGKLFNISTFGESHGGGVGVIIDGCPPRLELDINEIQNDLNRRRPGQSKITTPRNENDEVEITFTVSAKKLNSIALAMSVNFNDATAKIEFRGKPRKGTGSNPVSALKDAINSAGGEIED